MLRYSLLLLLFAIAPVQAQVSKLVKGQIVDQRTEQPADEVEISLKDNKTGKSYTTETDDDGFFELRNIPISTYTFHVIDKDYLDNPFPVEITEKHVDNYTFSLPITARLKVSWLFNWGDRETTVNGKKVVIEHYWSHLVGKIILSIYGLCLLLVFFYSILQLSLSIAYVRRKKGKSVVNPFSFRGRINRRDYLVTQLITLFIFGSIGLLLFFLFDWPLEILNYKLLVGILGVLTIVFCILNLAQATKRCHDVGVSGWMQLVPFYAIYLYFVKGTDGENKYGFASVTPMAAAKPVYDPLTTPKVTVQLPMFNELYVADRIIETIAKFDYPIDKLQIQVLDDSTDETKDVIAKKVAEVAARGVNIQHIHRVDRTGYKAGALDAAMDQVESEFIAIFDADFIPDADFLQKTMPYFSDDKIGVVQTRWGHINKEYSILTELQAFGLNGHFAIEQGGRNASGHFINFNGTGGIWRKKCIEEAGGWEHDTLTEDLDLSYRAQIKGWKFKYLEDVIAPAELPITMSALKSQQHRWMKGGAECFVKMWRTLLTAKNVKLMDRVHGLSHLFNSTVFFFILIVSLLSLVVLHIKDSFSDLNYILQYMGIFIVSTLFLMYYYWNAYRDKTENTIGSMFRFIGRFFQFLVVSMGLSLSNTVAVIEGYMGIKSSFVRTPKFNVLKKSEFKGNKYDKKSLSIINILEGILMVVFGFTAVNRAIYGDLGMLPFHLMLSIGYGVIFFSTLKEIRGEQAA
jgi:cellulose synthase/poly-beta-1,6-N-acetylglucosamine synthase-like glycosyltransferase